MKQTHISDNCIDCYNKGIVEGKKKKFDEIRLWLVERDIGGRLLIEFDKRFGK